MELSQRFCEALCWATRLHAEQKRKFSDAPYVAHLLRTAGIALEHGADEDEAIAALLHDAIEDQGGEAARREILERFGPRVAEIVEGATDADRQPKPPWRPRKEAHLARLRNASASVRLVVACDKLDNAQSILAEYLQHGEAIWDRFRSGRDGALWYYRSAVDILRQGQPSPLLDELDRVVGQLERAAENLRNGAMAKKSP